MDVPTACLQRQPVHSSLTLVFLSSVMCTTETTLASGASLPVSTALPSESCSLLPSKKSSSSYGALRGATRCQQSKTFRNGIPPVYRSFILRVQTYSRLTDATGFPTQRESPGGKRGGEKAQELSRLRRERGHSPEASPTHSTIRDHGLLSIAPPECCYSGLPGGAMDNDNTLPTAPPAWTSRS